jgi:hypothetical protein
VVESCLERGTAAASATSAPATPTASGAIAFRVVALRSRLGFALCQRGLEVSGDQSVVFCSQVKFFFDTRR